MKKIFNCFLFLLLTQCLFSQVVEEEMPSKTEKAIFTYVENMPMFPGGEPALLKYLSSNLNYPEDARYKKNQGLVILKFVVNTDGSLSDIEVLRSVKGGCDEEAIRVVKTMPKWIPGKEKGEIVNVYYTLPIKFKIEG